MSKERANEEFAVKLEEDRVRLGTGVAEVLLDSKWWEGTKVDRGIVLAMALVVDNERLICPTEVYHDAVVERLNLEDEMSLEALSTREGRTRIRRQYFEQIAPRTRQQLLRLSTAYIEESPRNCFVIKRYARYQCFNKR